ncbi:MAG: Gfo/Idh/MocA family oxidoreductase [Armatimonadota bacterium]|nr:Gfo/Idh/MocA family oxidoreductase [Armatimonadota bacterium]
MEIKVCIVGCGQMGNQHAAGWVSRGDVRVVSVCDPIEERRNSLAQKTGAVAYENYQDAILHEGVNIVSICTPVCFHSEIACFAAKFGRHILCEKPLALTLEQADEMIRIAKKNNVFLSTSFQYRGLAKNIRYKEIFQQGAFGGPIFARFEDIREVRPKIAMHRCSMNGGPIIDMAGHFFDLMRWITREEPVSVFARGHIFGKGKERLLGIDDLAIDTADIIVEMSGGHVLNVLVNWGMPEGFTSLGSELLVGPNLAVRPLGSKLEIISGSEKNTCDLPPNPPGSTVRINDMVDAVREGREPEVTGKDGRIALAVSIAALRSIETGEVVRLSSL